eukprot:364394-Chlamydomonas_euryale.AAC.4
MRGGWRTCRAPARARGGMRGRCAVQRACAWRAPSVWRDERLGCDRGAGQERVWMVPGCVGESRCDRQLDRQPAQEDPHAPQNNPRPRVPPHLPR